MTEIEWKPAEKKLELAIRMFTDDLEKALTKDCNCKTDLSVTDKEAAMNQILVDYIQKNCRIFSGRQKAALHFIGREKEEESTWSYFEVTGMDIQNGIDIEITLLYSIQEKQVNLLRFKKPGTDKTIQLKNPESKASFN